MAALQDRMEVRADLPATGGWQRCGDLLADPARFDVWRKLLGEWLRDGFGEAPERTTAGFVMSWYLHVPAFTGALLLHHERRVPMLRPGELAFRLCADRPHPEGVAVLGDEFYCLPGDPDADRPEATVVADERALAAALRARYTAHAAQFVQAYAPLSRLGRRMLWAAATDALDSTLWWAGLYAGDEEAGVADAQLVLDEHYPPLTASTRLRQTGDGWARRRESCCFSYLLPEQPLCEGCPRTCRR
ncbi:(2Fe-2S)-binding protein [Amycolatopsis thermoflava]|uniref:(2Fe-2S)-binding protein n=1 Tax=Amycolatopsis thermoflava TaxID=84480 RepID=UPI00040A72A0|nr:(2Fe-2S)-binding protein [Amycolatopsis thermoflava]